MHLRTQFAALTCVALAILFSEGHRGIRAQAADQLDMNHPMSFGMKDGRPALLGCSETNGVQAEPNIESPPNGEGIPTAAEKSALFQVDCHRGPTQEAPADSFLCAERRGQRPRGEQRELPGPLHCELGRAP